MHLFDDLGYCASARLMNIKDKTIPSSHILILPSFLVLPCQMVFKSFPDSRHHLCSANPERHEEPAQLELVKLTDSDIVKEIRRNLRRK